jgi:hypothetical protein
LKLAAEHLNWSNKIKQLDKFTSCCYNTVIQTNKDYKMTQQNTKNFVRFLKNSGLEGYGFDIKKNRLVKFKYDESSLNDHLYSYVGDSYTNNFVVNGVLYIKAEIQREAAQLTETTPTINTSATVVGPEHAYIMFSIKDQTSQYFKKGTPFDQAMLMFQRRGFVDMTLSDVQILNPLTGVIIKPKATAVTIVSYTFE